MNCIVLPRAATFYSLSTISGITRTVWGEGPSTIFPGGSWFKGPPTIFVFFLSWSTPSSQIFGTPIFLVRQTLNLVMLLYYTYYAVVHASLRHFLMVWYKVSRRKIDEDSVCGKQALRQDFAARGAKNHKEGHIFKYKIGCMQQPPQNKSLVTCKHQKYFTFNSTQKVIQVWTPKRPNTVICSFATWAREETTNSLSCKSLKPLSLCRLSSRFTFAPRSSFHTSYTTSGGSLHSRTNANRRYNVAIEAQKQKEWHPINLWDENKLLQRMVLTPFWNQHSCHIKSQVFLYAFEESVDCALLSSFCDHSNLHISIVK